MITSLKNETFFWKKKEFISFILSVLIFFIHSSTIAQYANSGSSISVINENFTFFFKESITRFAVPMFFILSGISFFKGYDNKKYCNKIKSRIFTLIIPYLLWNTIWMLFEIFCSYSFVSKYFGREPFYLTFTNILKGVLFYQCNGPFWFIFDIIIFSIAAPLIDVVIRNKYIGVASIGLLTILATLGIGVPESVFFTSTSIIFYLIGAIIGKHFFDFAFRKTSKKTQLVSVLFLLTYIFLKNIFRTQTNPPNEILKVVIFTLSAFALWSVTDIFVDKIKQKSIYTRSFAIYALHINLSAIITKILFFCFPKSEWFAIPNFIITVILTLFLINLICSFLERFFPKIYSILMGKRLKHDNNPKP